jgi:hypothetical protein
MWIHHDLRVQKPRFPDNSASADRVLRAAAALGFQLDEFENCLSLFEHLQAHLKAFKHTGAQDDAELFQRSGWRIVAAKQAALTVWHFKKALDEFREAVNADPAIRDVADTKRIKAAIETTFKAKFPDWSQMRSGVAHAAEMVAEYDKHSAPGPTVLGGIQTDMPIMGAALKGDTYTVTIDGGERSCEVSRKTLEALEHIAEECRQSLESPQPLAGVVQSASS